IGHYTRIEKFRRIRWYGTGRQNRQGGHFGRTIGRLFEAGGSGEIGCQSNFAADGVEGALEYRSPHISLDQENTYFLLSEDRSEPERDAALAFTGKGAGDKDHFWPPRRRQHQ